MISHKVLYKTTKPHKYKQNDSVSLSSIKTKRSAKCTQLKDTSEANHRRNLWRASSARDHTQHKWAGKEIHSEKSVEAKISH